MKAFQEMIEMMELSDKYYKKIKYYEYSQGCRAKHENNEKWKNTKKAQTELLDIRIPYLKIKCTNFMKIMIKNTLDSIN